MLGIVRRNPAFARLWMSQIVSQTGDWLNRMACIQLISRLGGDSSRLGAFYGLELALRLLPPAVFGPLAGPLADRLSRRFLMVASDVLRAVVVLAFLCVDEPGELPLLWALILLQMGTSVFFDVARTAALPDTVSRDELFDAHALSAATWSVILGIGALAGGVLVGQVGVSRAFVVDAASYVLSALLLVGMKLPPPRRRNEPFRWSEVFLFTELRRGLEHARGLGLGSVLWAKTFWGGAGGFLVLLSLAGTVRFGESATGANARATGALYAARGLGTWLGPVLLRRSLGTSDRGLRRQIVLGFAFASIGYAAFGFTTSLTGSCIAVAFAHLGGAALWVASTILWQKHVSDAFRGRVFAVEYLGMCSSFAVFGLAAGFVYDRTHSLPVTIWANAGAVLALGAVWSRLARDVGRAGSPAVVRPTFAAPIALPVEESPAGARLRD